MNFAAARQSMSIRLSSTEQNAALISVKRVIGSKVFAGFTAWSVVNQTRQGSHIARTTNMRMLLAIPGHRRRTSSRPPRPLDC